jgi:transposase InsO family protein
MITRLSTGYSVKLLCQTLGVSRSGYLAARERVPSKRQEQNKLLVDQIQEVYEANRSAYGSPRVTRELIDQGIPCNEKRVARLMRQEGLRGLCKKRYRPRTTDSNHDQPIAPNRLPNWLGEAQPDRVAWVGDITYIETREGWLYLAALMDLEVRKIVGWAAEDHMREELVHAALIKAMRQCREGVGVLHHSDQGSQYAARGYRACLERERITPSMSAAGYCYDNAFMESFWATLKRECFGDYVPQTRAEARLMIFDYIEVFYNRRRRHSSLGYLSPVDYEVKLRYMKN